MTSKCGYPGCTCTTCQCSCPYCASLDFLERLKGTGVSPNVASVVSILFVSWASYWNQSYTKP